MDYYDVYNIRGRSKCLTDSTGWGGGGREGGDGEEKERRKDGGTKEETGAQGAQRARVTVKVMMRHTWTETKRESERKRDTRSQMTKKYKEEERDERKAIENERKRDEGEKR